MGQLLVDRCRTGIGFGETTAHVGRSEFAKANPFEEPVPDRSIDYPSREPMEDEGDPEKKNDS